MAVLMRFGDQWASLLVAIPLFGAFLIPLCYAIFKNRKVAPVLGIITTGLGLITALDVLRVVLGGHVIEVIMGGYIPPIGVGWRIDIWGGLLATLIYLIGFLAAIYSVGYVKEERWVQYYAVMMVMIAGAVGVAVTGDLFNMFVFLEVASISAYILVSTDPEPATLEASFKYLVLGSLATSFILLGIALLYGAYHTLNIYDMATKIGANPVLDSVAIALLLVGLGVEGAMFPLNSWLPDAHPSAPSPISAMLSGTLIKIGLVGIVRVMLMVRNTPYFDRLMPLLLVWGILTSIWGELSALRQKDIKRLMAHSSSAQMGYIVAALSTFTPVGIAAAVMHMLVHALSKALLFMSAGHMIHARHTRDIEGLRGSGRSAAGCAYVVGALSLMGLPPMPGFFSKFLILVAVYQKWGSLPVLLIFMAAAVEVFYYLRLTTVLLDAGEWVSLSLWIELPMAVLGAIIVVLGFMPSVLEWIAAGRGALTSAMPYMSIVPAGKLALPFWLMLAAAAVALVPALRVLGIIAGVGIGGYLTYLMVLSGGVPAVVALLTFMAVCGILIAHIEGDGKVDGIKDALLMAAFAFLIMVLASGNMYALMYYWELMSAAAFFMFLIEPERAMSGVIYTTMMTVLSYIFMLGIVSAYAHGGDYRLGGMAYAFAGLMVLVAMAFKLGLFPMHVWAEYGYEGAHPVVAGYLSGAVSKVAMMLAFLALMYAAIPGHIRGLMILFGAVTIVWAGYRAIRSDDLMGILAFSSISQMSYVLVGLLIGGSALAGAWLHALGHAVFETGLFLVAYLVLMLYGTTKIEELRGKGGVHPVILYLAVVLVLSLAGVPPLVGFVSKWLMYQGALIAGYHLVAVLMMIGSAMSMMYGLRFVTALTGRYEGGRGLVAALPLAFYSLVVFVLGVFPWPFFGWLGDALKGFGVRLPLTWKELILGVSGGGYYTAGLIIILFALSLLLFLVYYMLMTGAELKGKVFRGGTFYEPTDENLPSLADMLWPMAHVTGWCDLVDRWHVLVADITAFVADMLRGVYTGYLPDYALYVSVALALIVQFVHM